MSLLKKCLRSKRGVAMPLAIYVIVVVFGLCTILLTTAMLTYTRERALNERIELSLESDYCGECLLYAVRTTKEMTISGEEDAKTWAHAYIERYNLRSDVDSIPTEAETEGVLTITRDEENALYRIAFASESISFIATQTDDDEIEFTAVEKKENGKELFSATITKNEDKYEVKQWR